ncbi:hypothetical protein QO001_005641 [Methylobacterium brachiatum]|uniref:Uncharacterized protein n=1 Tax=Methylobacterium brachiatum TaxID=269660 RepID=A0AAJ1WXK4_9HYPH|nr:hypothetical protein [Methylobacterium brachiatum]
MQRTLTRKPKGSFDNLPVPEGAHSRSSRRKFPLYRGCAPSKPSMKQELVSHGRARPR